MGMRATIEIHHAVTVYSSKFPALLGTTMVDYTDALQASRLALQAYTGIQT